MRWLKQATASQIVQIGPFVDDTDYVTAETGLTIANTDIKFTRAGDTVTTNKNSGGATHLANGVYYMTLDATDTTDDGVLEVMVKMSGALLVREAFMVMSAAGYDAVIGDTGAGLVADVWNVGGVSQDIATATALATVDSNVDAVLVDTGTTIPASLTTIDNEIATIDGIVDAILVDTGTTLPATLTTIDNEIAVIDGIVDAILVDTAEIGVAGAGLTAVPTVDANVVQTAGITILTDGQGRFLTDVRKISNSTTAPTNLSDWMTNSFNTTDDVAVVDISTASVDAVLDEALSGHVTAGTLGKALADIETDATAILADTNELQTDDVPGLIAALNDITVADVLAGSITEPANGDESFTGLTLLKVLGLINAHLHNKGTLNRSTGAFALRNQADSANIVTATDSDDGTTFTKGARS